MRYRPPAEHDGVTLRNDTGVFEGGEISLYYDPMIAKLVTHPRPASTIDAQADALDAFTIEGIRHNIPFLAAIMQRRWRWQAEHGFHRRGISGGFAAAADGRGGAHACRGWPPPFHRRARKTPLRAIKQRRDPRTQRRAIGSAAGTRFTDVVREGDAITVLFEDGNSHVLSSKWIPGMPGLARRWHGRGGAGAHDIPNGFELAHRGVEVKAFVYTEREAAYA